MELPRKIISIQQPESFPWLGFFDKIRQVDQIVFLDNVQFKKRYFENRNKVRTYQGWTYLGTPVLSKGRFTQKICEVEIDNTRPWQKDLVNTISFNYRKAPHWGALGDELCELISRPYSLLVDFNLAVIFLMMKKLELSRPFRLASTLGTTSAGSELIFEISRKMEASAYLSGKDGRNYLDEAPFREAGIGILYQDFRHPAYTQFQGGFEPAMSVIDLYFNHGPEAKSILVSGQQGEQNATG